MLVNCGVAAVLALAAPAAAPAATLDFTVFPAGSQASNVLNLPEATVTGLGDTLFVGSSFGPNRVCSIIGGYCEADMEVAFAGTVSNLAFDASGYHPGDFIKVSAFDSMDNLLASFDIAANGDFGFGTLGGISRIFFDNSSTGAGMFYGNFRFDQQQQSTAVPLPASLILLASAFGATGLFLRRPPA
jgi:hypothetical protein